MGGLVALCGGLILGEHDRTILLLEALDVLLQHAGETLDVVGGEDLTTMYTCLL